MKISIDLTETDLQELMDYNYKTTLWQDFTIAEMFGESAIR